MALQCLCASGQADHINVRTLRLASGAGRRPRHPHEESLRAGTARQGRGGVTPLDPESPHAYWQLQNRAVSAPLAWRPAVGTGVRRLHRILGETGAAM
jgi:hypothetical protein